MNQIPEIFFYGLLLNIGHYLLIIQKKERIPPTPDFMASVKGSDHVVMKLDGALVYYPIDEPYNIGRFYLLATSYSSQKL